MFAALSAVKEKLQCTGVEILLTINEIINLLMSVPEVHYSYTSQLMLNMIMLLLSDVLADTSMMHCSTNFKTRLTSINFVAKNATHALAS